MVLYHKCIIGYTNFVPTKFYRAAMGLGQDLAGNRKSNFLVTVNV